MRLKDLKRLIYTSTYRVNPKNYMSYQTHKNQKSYLVSSFTNNIKDISNLKNQPNRKKFRTTNKTPQVLLDMKMHSLGHV